jgi:hypothetical protein
MLVHRLLANQEMEDYESLTYRNKQPHLVPIISYVEEYYYNNMHILNAKINASSLPVSLQALFTASQVATERSNPTVINTCV